LYEEKTKEKNKEKGTIRLKKFKRIDSDRGSVSNVVAKR